MNGLWVGQQGSCVYSSVPSVHRSYSPVCEHGVSVWPLGFAVAFVGFVIIMGIAFYRLLDAGVQ